MTAKQRALVFLLEESRYGLPLERVERVVRAVEITPLPRAPAVVLGVINAQGSVIPAVDPRRRFGLAPAEVSPEHQMVIARSVRRTVALLVDTVSGVAEYLASELVPPESIVPGTGHLAGVLKTDDGLILIQDLDRFLSLEEESRLDAAMSHA